MKWREVVFLACVFSLNVALLAACHLVGDPAWLSESLTHTAGSDGILWQVQTTFLSVGFAGLAIAAQLFAEAPLAIGASRGRVLSYIGASWFVGVGLACNALLAIETIWIPSVFGVMCVVLWSVLTVVLLVVATVRLTKLFGHPSRLDEVVRVALVEAVSGRLQNVPQHAAGATALTELLAALAPPGPFTATGSTLRVPVPEVGRIVKSIDPKRIREAMEIISPRAEDVASGPDAKDASELALPRLVLELNPGDRTRYGQSAFRVLTSHDLSRRTLERVAGLLQSSLVFEPTGAVTPHEETDRDIGSVKDAIATSLRAGAFSMSERAMELLGQIVRGVWLSLRDANDGKISASFAQQNWLFRTIGEVEQDAIVSARAADILVSAAMTRAIEAPNTGSLQYVDESLRSFTRIWSAILHHGGADFDVTWARITTCIQNLAAYSYATADDSASLKPRGVWAMVELVKLAIDARKIPAARLAADELRGLFEYDRDDSLRAQVRGGQLVLSGWLEYLRATGDDRATDDARLLTLVTPHGTLGDVRAARATLQGGSTPFSRWDWWEMEVTGSSRVRTLQLPHYIDLAQVSVMASSHGSLPAATDQVVVHEYERLLRVLSERGRELTAAEQRLGAELKREIDRWAAAEDARLADEPLSELRLEELRRALRESVALRRTIADELPETAEPPSLPEVATPILGMNFRVPRDFMVEGVFNATHADPRQIGHVIAQGFADGEDQRAVESLRILTTKRREPTAAAVMEEINRLAEDARHYVLVMPYGGLDDLDEWHSEAARTVLSRLNLIETAALETEALLFDRRSTLKSYRRPEEKEGLEHVSGTTIALGIFEDVEGEDEPQVRLESGEYFVLVPGDAPEVVRFYAAAGDERSG